MSPHRFAPIALLAGALAFGPGTPFKAQELPGVFPGVVFPATTWEVTTSVDGRIRHLYFEESQFMEKGDLLVELDDTEAALQVQLAEVELLRAQAILTERIEDLEVKKELATRDAVSVTALGDAEFDTEIARLDLAIAESRLDIAREDLRRHKIYSPGEGIISAPRYGGGTFYSAALSGSIAQMVKLDPIQVRIAVRPDDVLRRIDEGRYTLEDAQELEFEMFSPLGDTFRHIGKAVSVGFEIDGETGEGSVIVEFPNPDGILRPGLPVHIRVRK